jgi:hypothetical protein
MKRALLILIILIAAFALWWLFIRKESHKSEPKQEAIQVGKHSVDFNQAISDAVDRYLNMKNAFADGDTSEIKTVSQKFIAKMDSLNLGDLRKDSSEILLAAQQEISDIKANAGAILQEKDIREMRQDFRMVSENLYPFLKTIGYEGKRLYWKNCPSAFGENQEGNWISDTKEILNPYLGKNNVTSNSDGSNAIEIKDSL